MGATDTRIATATDPSTGRVPSTALVVLGLALAYLLTGWIGLLVASKPGNVTALWPPSGIALTVLLVWGRRGWPGVLLGSFLTNIFFFPAATREIDLFVGPLAIALGSTGEIVLASWLIERFAEGRSALATPANVLRFAACCAAASGFAAVTGLVATSTLGQLPAGVMPSFLLTWWLGDAVGMLALAPLALRDEAPSSGARWLEWMGVFGLTLFLGQLVFGRPLPFPAGTSLPLAWLMLPSALWAGWRLGGRAVALQALLVHALSAWSILEGRGPLAGLPPHMALVMADGLLVGTLFAGLLFTAGSAQMRRSRVALEREHRSLEGKVAERTAKLEEANRALQEEASERARLGAQLVEAQKQEAIGRLAGGVAHDFNNLLTVIVAEAGLVSHSAGASPEVKDSVLAILAASARAAELTKQLLAVARKGPGAPKVVDAGSALTETRRLLRPILPENIELDVITSEIPCAVRIDPTQLDQVILNLAINARDAMSVGGRLSMRQSLHALDEPAAASLGLTVGRWVSIDVSDTGGGIEPDVLSRIFEPFFTTKPSGRGTGLGLSTALGIAELAGGALRVESTVGVGSTFSLWLPHAQGPVSRLAVVRHAIAGAPQGGSTILVAEDEPLVRRVIVTALAREGHRILVANDGEEALSLARQHSKAFDLLLTDVVMPRMGGASLVRALREVAPVRALFMSGYHEQQAELAHEHLLPKPFTADELVLAVRAALERFAT